MAYNEASAILASHGVEYRPAASPDHIDALLVFVCRDGKAGEQWETIRCTRSAIRAWLGY